MTTTTSPQPSSWKRLTPDEASRALYIDFEGPKDKPPVLLGVTRWSRPGQLRLVLQMVCEERFAPLAAVEELPMRTLAGTLEYVLQRAEAKDRRIVAWTEHERDIVKEHCPEFLARFDARFCNGRALAERWRNKVHGGRKPTGELAAYLQLIGYLVPAHAVPGNVGTTLSTIAAQLQRGPTRGALLTDGQWQKWLALRDHNRHDCAGMRKVCLVAAREIAAADNPMAGASRR